MFRLPYAVPGPQIYFLGAEESELGRAGSTVVRMLAKGKKYALTGSQNISRCNFELWVVQHTTASEGKCST